MNNRDTKAGAQADGLGEEAVVDYLQAHADFFERHTHLLTKLRLRHPTGEAVSLIERQVELLRNQNRTLERRLVDLVEVARANDSVLERLHALAVGLLGADDAGERVRLLEDILRSRFGADEIRLLLFAGQPAALGLANVDRVERAELAEFARFLEEGKPTCGRLRPAQLEYLFPQQAASMASAALVPIGSRARFGLLALGSREAERFSPTLGTVFLNRIGELVEQALQPLLRD